MTIEEKIFNISLIPYCSMNLIHFHLERKKMCHCRTRFEWDRKKFGPVPS